MAKRKLLLPNVVYKRDLNPKSILNASLDVKGGVINVYNFSKVNLAQNPPTSKDEMTLDYISPLDEDTWPVDTMSDFFLYEVVSGNPKVVGMNMIG